MPETFISPSMSAYGRPSIIRLARAMPMPGSVAKISAGAAFMFISHSADQNIEVSTAG